MHRIYPVDHPRFSGKETSGVRPTNPAPAAEYLLTPADYAANLPVPSGAPPMHHAAYSSVTPARRFRLNLKWARRNDVSSTVALHRSVVIKILPGSPPRAGYHQHGHPVSGQDRPPTQTTLRPRRRGHSFQSALIRAAHPVKGGFVAGNSAVPSRQRHCQRYANQPKTDTHLFFIHFPGL